MEKTWDSTPTRTAGRHRAPAPTNATRAATRRTLIRFAIAGTLLATIVATLATHPAAVVAISVLLAPAEIAAFTCCLTSKVLTAAGR